MFLLISCFSSSVTCRIGSLEISCFLSVFFLDVIGVNDRIDDKGRASEEIRVLILFNLYIGLFMNLLFKIVILNCNFDIDRIE